MFTRQIFITCGRSPALDPVLSESFGPIDVIPGVNTNDRVVPKAVGYHGTPGEFGRIRSHARVLEDAIMADVPSLLVLEDDARAEPDFVPRLSETMGNMPDDWQCILFGGRHHARARSVRPGVARCAASGIPVAYAIRGEAMRALYGSLAMMPMDAERAMQEMCRNFPVYAADPFIVGQAAGRSTTTRQLLPERSFNDALPERWFSHTGNMGDLLYALPAIRAAGGGTLYLFQDHRYGLHPMGRRQLAAVRPLLLAQPYVHGVEYWEEWQARNHELNNFREYALPGRNIADAHLAALGLPYAERDTPWLAVDAPETVAPVVIARSARYRNPRFRWDRVHDKYADDAVFIGTRAEWELYTREVGAIRWHPTADLLDAARVIAGATLFVGNQSAPYAIAEGLKQRVVLEVSPDYPDCIYRRPGATHGYDETLQLPEVLI